MMRWAFGVSIILAIVSGCVTMASEAPAVLSSPAAGNIDALKGALSRALGRRNITFGAGDPTEVSSVSILPPPPSREEGRSVAKPIVFDLILSDGVCYAKRRDTDELIALDGVKCRPADG